MLNFDIFLLNYQTIINSIFKEIIMIIFLYYKFQSLLAIFETSKIFKFKEHL